MQKVFAREQGVVFLIIMLSEEIESYLDACKLRCTDLRPAMKWWRLNLSYYHHITIITIIIISPSTHCWV